MSYWYERIGKKQILILLSMIPVVSISGAANIVGSYGAGCIATASRTLFDWISVDRSGNSVEIYPYVFMQFETGCIEWLGFSTCETVQFQDWMQIWSETEIITIHILNTTTTSQGGSPESSQASPFTIERQFSDAGTSVSRGRLGLRRKVRYSLGSQTDQLKNIFVVRNPTNSPAPNQWIQVTLGQLLGVSQSNLVYLNTNTANEQADMIVPSPTNKFLRADSLLYFLNVPQQSRRCLLDDFCDTACTWNGLCEPMGYGHHGMLLPSATFFLNWSPLSGLGHWPTPGWKYSLFCPLSKHDSSCLRTRSHVVVIFNSDTSSRIIFKNTGDWSSEKYPLLEIQLWQETGYMRRNGDCDQIMIGEKAKYCHVPPEYVALEESLFLSRPRFQDGDQGMYSEIHSERVTGLRFYHNDVWQMNYRVSTDAADSWKLSTYFPVFWIEKRSGTLNIADTLGFSSLKSYGVYVMTGVLVSYILFLVCYFSMIYLLLQTLTCPQYLKARGAGQATPAYI